ncbi:MAG: hypothetical protein ACTSXL_01220 [Alphaproteobacteria bacterium]
MKKILIIFLSLVITGCSVNFNVKEQVKKEDDGTISRDITVIIAPEEVEKIVSTLGRRN